MKRDKKLEDYFKQVKSLAHVIFRYFPSGKEL